MLHRTPPALFSPLTLPPASVDVLLQTDAALSGSVVTVPQVAEALGLTYQATARHIDSLVTEGVLAEITGQSRNRISRADGVIEAIASPLASAATEA